jgi:hypothetical protein
MTAWYHGNYEISSSLNDHKFFALAWLILIYIAVSWKQKLQRRT